MTADIGLLKRMNWGMTLVLAALLTVGVMFIYSACYISEETPVRTLYLKQAMWIVVAGAAYLVFALYDYRRLRKAGPWFYAVSMALLVLVLFAGKTIYGSKRWLPIVPPLGIGIQPSELAKLAVIVMLAAIMSRFGVNTRRFGLVILVLVAVAVPMVLVVVEPDVGTALIFLPVAFVMMFVAGVPLRYLSALVAIGLALVALVVTLLLAPQRLGLSVERAERITSALGVKDYHRRRLKGFIRPGSDPLGAGWNKMQSQISVGSGGKWGKGYTKGDQNILGFLPRSVAPTDFIYAVIAEEMGFFGSVVVLALFCLLLACGAHVALKAQDKLGRLLCVGVMTVVFCHVMVNIAMTVGYLPIMGLPLPLLSYGGTFMVVTMSGMGIIQSVNIRSRPRVRSL
ncbi:rod shape-determining protein RodA [Verrucomicrobiota bacterium]